MTIIKMCTSWGFSCTAYIHCAILKINVLNGPFSAPLELYDLAQARTKETTST